MPTSNRNYPLIQADEYLDTDWVTKLTSLANMLDTDISDIMGIGGSAGIVAVDAAGGVVQRSLAVGSGLSVANATGVAGNPTVSLGTTLAAIVSTGIVTSMFATNVVDTDSTLAANSNTRLPSQAAIKSYVDNLVTGLAWKQAVRAATTANGTLASAFANGQTIDGVTLATGDRILIKNQSSASENGIYIVAASGAPSRASDADSSAEIAGATVSVREGTANADTQWTCTNNSGITIGSTSIVFAQMSGAGTYSATGGVVLTGNQFSADAGTSGHKLVWADGANVWSAGHTFLANPTIGAGSGARAALVNGGSGTGEGAALQLQQGGTNKAIFGTHALIFGGTDADIVFYCATDHIYMTRSAAKYEIADTGNAVTLSNKTLAAPVINGAVGGSFTITNAVTASNRFYIDGAGNNYALSFRYSNAYAYMQIGATASATPSMIFSNTSGATILTLNHNLSSTFAGFVRIDSAGTPLLLNSTNSTPVKMEFYDAGTLTGTLGSTSTYPLYVNNNVGANKFFIDQSGNVTQYGGQYVIVAATPRFYVQSTSGGTHNTVIGSDNGNGFIGTFSADTFSIYTNSQQRAYWGTSGVMYQLGNLIWGAGGEGTLTYASGNAYIDSTGHIYLRPASGVVLPGADNTTTLGSSGNRWSVVYAATGTINTSDMREKTDFTAANDNELAFAREVFCQAGWYQWLASVKQKGKTKARKHFGLGAQNVEATATKHKLDPECLALFCEDEITEPVKQTKKEAKKGPPKLRVVGTRKGLRPEQLHTLGIAALFREIDELRAEVNELRKAA